MEAAAAAAAAAAVMAASTTFAAGSKRALAIEEKQDQSISKRARTEWSPIDRKRVAAFIVDLHGVHRMYHPYTARFADDEKMEAFLFDRTTWPVETPDRIFWECLIYDNSIKTTQYDIDTLKNVCRRLWTMGGPLVDHRGHTMLQRLRLHGRNMVALAMLELAHEFPEQVNFESVDENGYSLLWHSVDSSHLAALRICAAKSSRDTLNAPVISDNNQCKARPLQQAASAAWRGGIGFYPEIVDELLAYAHEDRSGIDLLVHDYGAAFDRLVRLSNKTACIAMRDKVKVATSRQQHYQNELVSMIRLSLQTFLPFGSFAVPLSALVASSLLYPLP